MKLGNIFFGILLLSLLSACSTPIPNRAETLNADYGRQPTPEGALSLIKIYMGSRLIDPQSAIYNCATPIKAWVSTSKMIHAELGGKVHYGYVMPCLINAKNRLGGYVGAEKRNFMIQLYANRTPNVFELPYPIEATPAPN